MGKPKRTLHSLSALTTSPPDQLPAAHTIAQLVKAAGNNLYLVHFPQHMPPHRNPAEAPVLVEMAPQFRSQIWLRRGGYVVVDTAAFEDRGKGDGSSDGGVVGKGGGKEKEKEGKEGKEGKEIKIKGEIVNVVREEKVWRKMSYWPKEFPQQDPWGRESDDDEEEEEENKEDGWDKIRYSDDEEDEDTDGKTREGK